MTRIDASFELKNTDRWMDFDLWAYLKLESKGQWSNERMEAAIEFHQEAERKFFEYKAETKKLEYEMAKNGASFDEISDFRKTRWPQHNALLLDWRRLGP
jgi:hypothetical protein